MHSPEKNDDKFGKGLVSTSRTYASPKGTGPGVRRSKPPLSACHTRCKCSMETLGTFVLPLIMLLWYVVYFKITISKLSGSVNLGNAYTKKNVLGIAENLEMFLSEMHILKTPGGGGGRGSG